MFSTVVIIHSVLTVSMILSVKIEIELILLTMSNMKSFIFGMSADATSICAAKYTVFIAVIIAFSFLVNEVLVAVLIFKLICLHAVASLCSKIQTEN